MGRGVRYLIGKSYYSTIGRKPAVNSAQQLILFVESGRTPVGDKLYQLELVDFDAKGEYVVQPRKLKPAIEGFKARLDFIEERGSDSLLDDYRQDLFEDDAQIKRGVNREIKAEAEAIVAASKATKQPLTPYQRKIIKPALDGRFLEYAEKEYKSSERKILARRLESRQRGKNDPSQRARAQELIDRGREAGFGANSNKGSSSANPFSNRKRVESVGVQF